MIRWILVALLAFGALNAFGGGWYGMMGAEGVPREWLDGSPFRDYFVPSAILFVVVGGVQLTASVALLRHWSSARTWSLAAGVVLLGWITVQLAIIGYVSWLQPTVLADALVVLALAARGLKGPAAP